MSTSTLIPRGKTTTDQHIDEIVRYANGERLPDVPWLTHLPYGEFRRGLRCLPGSTRLLKRIGDIVAASMLLVILLPVMLIIALLVKLTSPDPSFLGKSAWG